MSAPLKIKPTHLQKNSATKQDQPKKKKFLLRSVPLYIFLMLAIVAAAAMGIYIHFLNSAPGVKTNAEASGHHDPNVKVVRSDDESLIRPLLFVEIESEIALTPVKTRINSYLEQKKQEHVFTSASVYLKDLNAGIFMNINPDSLYDPASLMKVPLLMIYLKEAEQNPALLVKTFQFKRSGENQTKSTIKDRSLTDGKSYSVEELLKYMILYSDNEAFWLLCDNIDDHKFKELDSELDIPGNIDIIHFPKSDEHFIANVNSVAHYFNVLYNASYLSSKMSAYALDLLTKSTYRNGIVKNLGSDVLVAHKFGERTLSYMEGGQLKNLQTEFHEFGIVYLKDRPYLLGVMTRGNSSDQLQGMVSDISRIAYDEMKTGVPGSK